MFQLLILLVVKIACIISQNCSPRVYNIFRTGGSTLPADEIVSNHTVYSEIMPIECYKICKQEPKCVGFNYREKIGIVNCQLTNITGERNHNAMTGEWILMLDEKAKNYEEEKRKNDSVESGRNCAHLYNMGMRQDGVFTIDPDGLGSFQVRCDMTTDGNGWTVFQRRQDGSLDFYVGWSDYKGGFGDLNGEFWLGFDKIHRLTKSGQNVLRVDLMDFNDTESFAKYGTFGAADESDKYRLTIGNYSGDAGDSLGYHNQSQFSTKDSDNDADDNGNCATTWKGAWWYKNCYQSNLNGLYLGAGQKRGSGIIWNKWHSHSLKTTEMKLRAKYAL